MKISKYYYKKGNLEWQGPFFIWQLSKFLFDETESYEFWHKSICTESQKKHTSPHECPIIFEPDELKKRLKLIKIYFISILSSIVIPLTFFSINNTFNANVTINITNNWEHYPLKGTYNNKTATFEIAFLSNEYCWDFRSDNSCSNKQDAVKVINEQINAFPLFEKSLGIIAVGTASQESNSTNNDEYKRSIRRAKTEMKALKLNPKTNSKNLYELYLGLYKNKTSEDKNQTDYQRRMIIIGIIEQENNMTPNEIELALKNAIMDTTKKHPLRLDYYSNYTWGTIVHHNFNN